MAGGASVGQQAERYVMISHPLGVFKAWRNLSADVVAKHRNLRVGYRLPWVGRPPSLSPQDTTEGARPAHRPDEFRPAIP